MRFKYNYQTVNLITLKQPGQKIFFFQKEKYSFFDSQNQYFLKNYFEAP